MMQTALPSPATPARTWRQRWQDLIPEGRALPTETWQRRHRGIIWLLWAHVIGLALFGLAAGFSLPHSLAEAGAVALPTLAAMAPALRRRTRTAMSSLGLIIASAVLIHFSGGYIEMHFHFFVMVIVVSLYQDWITFFLTIGYVVLHHGLAGVAHAHLVYNHPDAIAHPWRWAFIHGAFVLAASIASIVNWLQNEQARRIADLVLEGVSDGICSLDYEGRLLFVNEAGARLLGGRAERLIGASLYDLIGHETAAGERLAWESSPLRKALLGRRAAGSAGERFRRPDGG